MKEENICHAKSYFPKKPEEILQDRLVERLRKQTETAFKRHQIMSHYGIQAQLFKMIEELTEAQTEVIKMLSGKPDKSLAHLIEELADVALMTDQIVDHYGERYKFKQVYDFKLQRTLERIKGKNDGKNR